MRACVRARTRGSLNGATTSVVIFCRTDDVTEDTVLVVSLINIIIIVLLIVVIIMITDSAAAFAATAAVAFAVSAPRRHAVLMFTPAPRDRFRVDVLSLAPNQRRHNTWKQRTTLSSLVQSTRLQTRAKIIMGNKQNNTIYIYRYYVCMYVRDAGNRLEIIQKNNNKTRTMLLIKIGTIKKNGKINRNNSNNASKQQ